MQKKIENPYPSGSDQNEIWEMLVRNDFEGFVNQDWSRLAPDFLDNEFFGIDMRKSQNPADWKLTFPTLSSYRKQWVKDSEEFKKIEFDCDLRTSLYQVSKLEFFDFKDDKVLVHKIFDGTLPLKGGSFMPLNWRSLFLLKKVEGFWRINGFCGYMYDE